MTVSIFLGHADFIELAGEAWKPLMDFKEYRVNSFADVEKCRSSDSFCVAHLPESIHPDWRVIVEALAALPQVGLVNAHARSSDEYLLCDKCSVRMVNIRQQGQRCDYCGTALNPDQSDPAIWKNTTRELIDKFSWAREVFHAKKKILTVENTYEPPEQLRRILDQLPADVGFTLDTGHALLYHGSALDYIYLLRDRLVHLHLHDNMGGNSERYHDSHLPPGGGISNWYAIASALRQVQFRGTATFECDPNLDWTRSWLEQLQSRQPASREDFGNVLAAESEKVEAASAAKKVRQAATPLISELVRNRRTAELAGLFLALRDGPVAISPNHKQRMGELYEILKEVADDLVQHGGVEELRDLFWTCAEFNFNARWTPAVLCYLLWRLAQLDPLYAHVTWLQSQKAFKPHRGMHDFRTSLPDCIRFAEESDWFMEKVAPVLRSWI
jgi:hypothetical protein